MQHQHGIAGIGLLAETVVRKAPERAVGHRLDAGKALHRLAVERHGKAGGALAVHARHGADAFGAAAVGLDELGRGLQMLGRIGRGRNDAVGRQHDVGGEGGREFLVFGMRGDRGHEHERHGGKKELFHGSPKAGPLPAGNIDRKDGRIKEGNRRPRAREEARGRARCSKARAGLLLAMVHVTLFAGA